MFKIGLVGAFVFLVQFVSPGKTDSIEFSFDEERKICINQNGERGLNHGHVGDCGDLEGLSLKSILKEEKIIGIKMRGANLRGVDFSGLNLSLTDLSYSNLDEAILDGAAIISSRLDGASLRGASFIAAELARISANGTHFESAIFTRAVLSHSRIVSSTLARSRMEHLRANDLYIENSSLDYSNLEGSFFVRSRFVGSSFRKARGHDVHFFQSNMIGTDFSGSFFPALRVEESDLSVDQNDLALCTRFYLQSQSDQNARKKELEVQMKKIGNVKDFYGVSKKLLLKNLPPFHLNPPQGIKREKDRVLFRDAFLAGARFDGVNLRWVDFSRSELVGASFRGADLGCSQFTHSDVRGAAFDYADISFMQSYGMLIDQGSTPFSSHLDIFLDPFYSMVLH